MAEVGRHLHSVINADGAAVLDVERNRIVSLNATGGYVWERLVRGLAINEIIHDLVHETGADPATVKRDMCAFVQQLGEQGFLQV